MSVRSQTANNVSHIDKQGLVAELWFMDGTKEPLINDWRF
jgi:hypothetical protein